MTIIPMLHASYSAITDFFILYIACLQKMKVPKFFPVHTTAMPKNFTVRFPQSLRIRHAAVKPVEMSTKQPSVHALHKKYRTIPIDLMYDAETVGNIISPPSSVIGFQPDGTIYNLRNNGKLLSHNIFKESLRDILQKSFSMGE